MNSEPVALLKTEEAPTVEPASLKRSNNPPPVRSDWKTMDKNSEEYRAYFVQRQREVCRYRLDSVRTGSSSSAELVSLWHSLDQARQEKVLDSAMSCVDMSRVESENLERPSAMDARPLIGALAALYAIIDQGPFIPQKKAQKKATRFKKGDNNLLKKAITNDRLRT